MNYVLCELGRCSGLFFIYLFIYNRYVYCKWSLVDSATVQFYATYDKPAVTAFNCSQFVYEGF